MKRKFGFKNQAYNEQLANIPQNFAVTHDEDNGVTELTIYGDIGDSWWYDSTSAADIDFALREANGNNIVIRLNSPGGSAFDGIAIYNRLKEHPGKVTIHVDGWACSAASIIAMAGDEVIMGAGAMIMIHEASTIVWGNKRDFRSQADMLEELENGIIDIYMTKAKISREEIREKVDAETWFSATKAIEIGFATSTSTTVEDNNEEVSNLKQQVTQLQSELDQIKNQQKEEPKPEPVKTTAKGHGFFF